MKTGRWLLPALLFLFSQQAATQNIIYLSPKPGSALVSRESNIILRADAQIARSAVSSDVIEIRGEQSGVLAVTATLSDDGQTMIFTPQAPFRENERVDVVFAGTVNGSSGQTLAPLRFSFTTTPQRTPLSDLYIVTDNGEVITRTSGSAPASAKIAGLDSLPTDLPRIQVDTVNSPAPGYFLLSTTEVGAGLGEYVFVVDNAGQIVRHKETHGHTYDFKQQPNGLLSYAEGFSQWGYAGGSRTVHRIVDSTLTDVDSVRAGNGYDADSHDFRMLANGHILLHAYDIQYVDMSTLVANGNPNAIVVGSILQELDLNRQVVFQWRSWDYIPIADTYMPVTASAFDYIHVNAYDMDGDGNILACFRNTCDIVKINRMTGDILWRMGGKKNDFTFIGENAANAPTYFTYQHCLERLPNGNFLLFDNGNLHPEKVSRAVEYAVDQVSKTATMVWEYRHTPDIFAPTRGSVQRLPNGNTLIGWGSSLLTGVGPQCLTEVRPDKSIAIEMRFLDPAVSYRAFKYVFSSLLLPAAVVPMYDVVPGVTYSFRKGDSVQTGVALNFSQITSGYNSVTVRRYAGSPVNPDFAGVAPFLQGQRWVIRQIGMTAFTATVTFDSTTLASSTRKDQTVVYYRPTEGSGTFIPLGTSFSPTGESITATTTQFGEFVVGIPAEVTAPGLPTLVLPLPGAKVNQTQPVTLQWSSYGRITGSQLHIATDSLFTALVLNDSTLRSSSFSWTNGVAGTQYFWRVRLWNESGMTAWSGPANFTMSMPYVSVLFPNDGNTIGFGSTVVVRWESNTGERVNVHLLRNGSVVTRLADSVENTGRYVWKVPATGLVADSGYAIRVQIREDTTLFSNSTAFSISSVQVVEGDDHLAKSFFLSQNYPNPFNPSTTIRFTLARPAHVTLTIYSIAGQAVATLVDGPKDAGLHEARFEPLELASGIYLYRIVAGTFTEVRKLVLLR